MAGGSTKKLIGPGQSAADESGVRGSATLAEPGSARSVIARLFLFIAVRGPLLPVFFVLLLVQLSGRQTTTTKVIAPGTNQHQAAPSYADRRMSESASQTTWEKNAASVSTSNSPHLEDLLKRFYKRPFMRCGVAVILFAFVLYADLAAR